MLTYTDKAIERARKGEKIMQWCGGDLTTYLIFMIDEFYLETWRYTGHIYGDILHRIECLSEETARFSLSAKRRV